MGGRLPRLVLRALDGGLMGFDLDAQLPPRPVPWVVSGSPEQLRAWREAAERAGHRDPLRWIQQTLDAAARDEKSTEGMSICSDW